MGSAELPRRGPPGMGCGAAAGRRPQGEAGSPPPPRAASPRPGVEERLGSQCKHVRVLGLVRFVGAGWLLCQLCTAGGDPAPLLNLPGPLSAPCPCCRPPSPHVCVGLREGLHRLSVRRLLGVPAGAIAPDGVRRAGKPGARLCGRARGGWVLRGRQQQLGAGCARCGRLLTHSGMRETLARRVTPSPRPAPLPCAHLLAIRSVSSASWVRRARRSASPLPPCAPSSARFAMRAASAACSCHRCAVSNIEAGRQRAAIPRARLWPPSLWVCAGSRRGRAGPHLSDPGGRRAKHREPRVVGARHDLGAGARGKGALLAVAPPSSPICMCQRPGLKAQAPGPLAPSAHVWVRPRRVGKPPAAPGSVAGGGECRSSARSRGRRAQSGTHPPSRRLTSRIAGRSGGRPARLRAAAATRVRVGLGLLPGHRSLHGRLERRASAAAPRPPRPLLLTPPRRPPQS
jgi:hypothetical protein